MCVINIKYAGQELPKLDKVRDMFETNPHGAGFMFVDDEGKLIIKKGYFTEEAFLKSFYTNNYLHNLVEKDVVLHFRIATSGKLDTPTCHPFRIRDGLGLAHNGIIHGLGNDIASDTQMLVDSLRNKSIEEIRKILKGHAGNKFALMNKSGVERIGDFSKDEDGQYCSNLNFKGYFNKYYDFLEEEEAGDDNINYDAIDEMTDDEYNTYMLNYMSNKKEKKYQEKKEKKFTPYTARLRFNV